MKPPDETLLTLLDVYADNPEMAYQAWYEVKFYEEHGVLPADTAVIERVNIGADGSLIFIHRDFKASQ